MSATRRTRRRVETFADLQTSLIKEGDCLLWQAGGKRYGIVRFREKTWQTHRVAYTLTKGEIPAGMYVCHTCDRPRCCNPEHLFIGTQDDNMKDMVKKGRAGSTAGRVYDGTHWTQIESERRPIGSANPQAKLDEEKVRTIRAMAAEGTSQKAIGLEFGLHPETVGCIVRRQTWKHVAPALTSLQASPTIG